MFRIALRYLLLTVFVSGVVALIFAGEKRPRASSLNAKV